MAHYDPSDFRPMGDPETTVELHGGAEILHGLWIPAPFGRQTAGILTVHAWRGNGTDGGVITAAITNTVRLEADPPQARPAMDMRLLQSNPRRIADTGDD